MRLIPKLVPLIDSCPGQAPLRLVDFQRLWSVGYVDWKDDTNKLQTYLEGVEKRRATNERCEVEPNADFFKHDFTPSDILPFYYFLQHHLKGRKNRVVPALEKWVPGCGRILINHGLNIFTEFGEMTPQEILNLYKTFKSWPEFKQSSFVSCMDTYLLRLNEHVGSDVNSDNLEEMFDFASDETQSPPE